MQTKFNEIYKKILTELFDDGDANVERMDQMYLKGLLKDTVYEDDNIDGAVYDRPGKIYHVVLKGTIKMQDASDMNRETGYGRLIYPVDFDDIAEFSVTEYEPGENGKVLRDTSQIETEDPELYKKIQTASQDAAIERLEY